MVARDICGVNSSSHKAMNTNHSICINTKHNKMFSKRNLSPVPWCRVHKISDPDLFTISDQKILFYPQHQGERIKITRHHQKIQQESIPENRWKENVPNCHNILSKELEWKLNYPLWQSLEIFWTLTKDNKERFCLWTSFNFLHFYYSFIFKMYRNSIYNIRHVYKHCLYRAHPQPCYGCKC